MPGHCVVDDHVRQRDGRIVVGISRFSCPNANQRTQGEYAHALPWQTYLATPAAIQDDGRLSRMESNLFNLAPSLSGPSGRDESVAMLAIGSIEGVGYKTLYNMFRAGLRFHDVLHGRDHQNLSQSLHAAEVKNSSALADRLMSDRTVLAQAGEAELARLAANHIRLLHHFEDDFPAPLRSIKDAPGWLFAQGNAELLARPAIAVVGSREASVLGLFLTDCVCFLLSGTSVCTVSGLAEGIDGEAHYASLCAKVPTIAVLGTGIDQQYPKSATGLRADIVRQGGCVVTEYLPSAGPTKQSFVWRNRLQAGLAKVVIPTQWRLQSGTAHTVRFAFENMRTVVGVRLAFEDGPEAAYLKDQNMPAFVLPDQATDLKKYLLDKMAEEAR